MSPDAAGAAIGEDVGAYPVLVVEEGEDVFVLCAGEARIPDCQEGGG